MPEATQEFKDKLRDLKVQIRRIMNGTTAEIMKKMNNAAYAANYGASLQHVRAMATLFAGRFSASECDDLWQMRWRETMMTAAMVIPRDQVTPQRLADWLSQEPTPEMLDVLACDLIGPHPQSAALANDLWKQGSDSSRALALLSLARAIMSGNAEASLVAQDYLSLAISEESWGVSYASGLSLLSRQLLRRGLLSVSVKDALLQKASMLATPHALRFAEDLRTEAEYLEA